MNSDSNNFPRSLLLGWLKHNDMGRDTAGCSYNFFTLGTSYSRDYICLCTCKLTLKDNGLSNFYRNFIFKEWTYPEVTWLSHRTNIALIELSVPL